MKSSFKILLLLITLLLLAEFVVAASKAILYSGFKLENISKVLFLPWVYHDGRLYMSLALLDYAVTILVIINSLENLSILKFWLSFVENGLCKSRIKLFNTLLAFFFATNFVIFGYCYDSFCLAKVIDGLLIVTKIEVDQATLQPDSLVTGQLLN